MSMKSEHAKVIAALSPENKKRFVKVVKNLETLAEATPVDEPIYFAPSTYLGSNGYDERTIVAKLEEWGVLTAEPEELNYGLLVFTSLEKLHEARGFLEGRYHSTLDDAAQMGMEEFLEDETQLINKLLQICTAKKKWVVLMHPTHLVENNSDAAGFNRIETLKVLQKEYSVFRSFNPPLPSTLQRTQVIKARINFAKLRRRAESLHDEIETWGSQVFGIEQQKRELLRRLQDRFNKNADQEVFEYSEKLLGAYTADNPERPSGYSLLQPDKNRPDTKYTFMRVMRELEKEGHFEIIDVHIDFMAVPQPTEDSIYNHRWSLGERSLEFYPAEHCKVTMRPKSKDKPVLIPPVKPIAKSVLPNWSDDFVWRGNEFIFGSYGSINFSSDDRKALFKMLTDARGNWVAINKLKSNKDANYARATIKQIEDRFTPTLKDHVSIPSTQDDGLEPKPSQGAYRIKFTP